MIRSRMPKDVLAQQQKVAAADALVFIAPVHFCSFPSILKGWIDRVFTLDFAFGLTSEGWHGDINGRIPRLHHRRALIMTSTIFDETPTTTASATRSPRSSTTGGFRYPGIDDVEHVYFYAATSAPPETIGHYLDEAYQLGRTSVNLGRPEPPRRPVPAASPRSDTPDDEPAREAGVTEFARRLTASRSPPDMTRAEMLTVVEVRVVPDAVEGSASYGVRRALTTGRHRAACPARTFGSGSGQLPGASWSRDREVCAWRCPTGLVCARGLRRAGGHGWWVSWAPWPWLAFWLPSSSVRVRPSATGRRRRLRRRAVRGFPSPNTGRR